MADATVINKYPKATNTKADVQKIQQQHLADGARSSVRREEQRSRRERSDRLDPDYRLGRRNRPG